MSELKRSSEKRRRREPAHPPDSGQSSSASRRAVAVLEVLAGTRTPGEAASVLRISVNYYYVLERKALRGLVQACEPAPKGPPKPSPEKQLEKLERELARCQRECQRQAALVRATQRAVGLPSTAPPASKAGGKTRAGKRRRRKPGVRALLAAKSLQKKSSLEDPLQELEQPQGKEDVKGTTNQAEGSEHDATR
jgi:hypothetical protein